MDDRSAQLDRLDAEVLEDTLRELLFALYDALGNDLEGDTADALAVLLMQLDDVAELLADLEDEQLEATV